MTRPNPKVARGGKWRRVVRYDPPLPVQEVVFDFAVTASLQIRAANVTLIFMRPAARLPVDDDGRVSAIGTKADITCAMHTSAYDPKRTFVRTRCPQRRRKHIMSFG